MCGDTDVKLTFKKRTAFLSALAEYGNVTQAADKAGVNRVYLYEVRAEDKAFKKEWEEAARYGALRLEDEARRRAIEGWEEPVWHKGMECGTVRKYSDTLLIVLLKAHHPEKYAERNKTEHSGTIATMTQEQIDAIYRARGVRGK